MKSIEWFGRIIPIVPPPLRKLSRIMIVVSMPLFVFGCNSSGFLWPGAKYGESWMQISWYLDGSSASQQTSQENVHFQLILSGRLGMKGADSVDFSNYKADDGTLLQRRQETYHSTFQANERMRTMIEKAKKLVSRGPNEDTHGNTIGERAVLITATSYAIIIWSRDRYLFTIRSKKLDYALAFEKQMDQSRKQ
jgi:hypothetical protein